MVEDTLYESYLLDDMSAGVRFDRGREDVESLHIVVVAVGVVLHHLHRFQLLQTGFFGDLILPFICIVLEVPHISNITYVTHLIAEVKEITIEQVEGNSGTCMAQVGITINGRTAYIHTHVSLVEGTEILFLTTQCVVNLKHNLWFYKAHFGCFLQHELSGRFVFIGDDAI